MKFVTSAYKKKLMEQKKWELQQQLEEEREQREDVTRTGMTGCVGRTLFSFYLTTRVQMQHLLSSFKYEACFGLCTFGAVHCSPFDT